MKLPLPSEKFVCLDPCRQDTYGKVMDNVHIEIYADESGIGFYCYGDVFRYYSRICFGFSRTLDGAAEVINSLVPYEGSVEDLYHNPQE